MRLIDADKLTEEWLDAENEPVYCANDVLSSIDEQPTAYDLDALDAVDELKTTILSALERQIPKKPIKLPESEQHIRYTDTYRCPTCGGNFSGTGVADYCYHCGQRLDWGEQE